MLTVKKFLIILISVVIMSTILLIGFFLYFFPPKYKELILKYSTINNLSPILVASLINCESGYDQNAISSAGAYGLMQLLPNTAKAEAQKLGLQITDNDLFEPETNILLGCSYLSYLITRYQDVKTALFAYNAGPSKVNVWLNDPSYSSNNTTLFTTPYPSTNIYANKIFFNMKYYIKYY